RRSEARLSKSRRRQQSPLGHWKPRIAVVRVVMLSWHVASPAIIGPRRPDVSSTIIGRYTLKLFCLGGSRAAPRQGPRRGSILPIGWGISACLFEFSRTALLCSPLGADNR